MKIDLAGRTALVSGAAQGIGRAIAAALRDAGAAVHLTDIDAEGLSDAAAALGLPAHRADLADPAEARHVVEAAGGPQILALAAGGVRGQVGRPFEEIAPPDWQAILAANLEAAAWVAQAALPAMKTADWGRIVTISSGAGLRPSLTGIQAYAAAKHALIGLTRQLALELGPHGITVNSVAPGLVRSNPATERQWESYGSEGQARLLGGIHTRRLGTAEDIAAATVFFCSDQAGWITGQVLSVDGGRA